MRHALACVLLLMAVPVWAQTPVKNPSGLIFACPDHALDDQHEVDIVRVGDQVVVQTLLMGDPPVNAQGDVQVSVNVQPVAFGLANPRM